MAFRWKKVWLTAEHIGSARVTGKPEVENSMARRSHK
jgi:hypothetical protein